MASPLSATAVLAALRAEGVRVVEVGSWRTHNRAGHGAWGPLNGSIVHHTVTSGTAGTVAMVRDGYADLPGPLCHGMIAKDGQVHMVGWGRANHAGGGDPIVLQHVINEDYGTRPPAPTKGNLNGVDGNSRFYGWECENLGNGKDPWPAVQYDAIVRVQAALCRAHGWSAKSVIGHLEWSDDKIDPRGFAMPDLRADVAERLTHPASWNPGSTPVPPEDDMPLTSDDVKKIFATDGAVPAARPPVSNDDYPTNSRWTAGYAIQTAVEDIRKTRQAVEALAPELTDAQVETIAAKVAAAPGLADAIASKVADLLAARLAN